MKNLFKSLMLVAVAAMAFTSCQNDIEEVNAVNKSVTLTFNAGFGEETRVDFAEAGNKAYKASWEAGDTVTFAVYEDASSDQPIEVAQTIEITEAADSVELTVSFNKLTAGNVIKAYVNYTAQQYGSWWEFSTSYYAQEPDTKGPSEVYASASVEYAAGVDYADLTFAHDYAYGLMTIEGLPFEADYFELRVNGGNQRTSVELKNVTDNKVWFYIDEYEKVYDLEVRIVSKEDYNQQRYFVRSFGEADTFAFTKGRVSRFTIDKWYTKLAAPQNLNVEYVGSKAVITWDADDNASAYLVSVNEGEAEEVETSRYELDMSKAAAFAKFEVEVVAIGTGSYMNSDKATTEAIKPISKIDEGTHNFIYDSVEVVDVYANTYKFYQAENADNFMYLSFRQALPTSGSVVYDFDDIETYPYGRSSFWMSSDLRPDGYNGFDPELWSSYDVASYIKDNVYTIYNNYGDACAIYVDVEGGKYAITAFVKNNNYFGSENLFKGSFNGTLSVKETLATPTKLEAAVDGYSVTLTWGEVKGATSYEVNFAGKTIEVATTSAKFDGVAVGYHSATVVAKAEGYNDSEAARLDNIQVKQVFETVEIESVVAGAVDGDYTPLTFTTKKGDVLTTKAGNGGVNYLNEGTWDYNNWYDSGYALYNVFLNGDTWVSTFVMEVKHVEGKYELTIESSVGNFHFLGDITGLVVPGYEPVEPTIPTYVFTSAELQWNRTDWTGINVDLFTNTGDKLHLNFDGCTTANFIPEDTYQIAGTLPAIYIYSYSKVTFAGVEYSLEGGSVKVEEVDGKYRFTMNEVSYGYYNSYTSQYSNLAKFNGSFVGEIEGLILPSEYVAPEPGEPETGDAIKLGVASIQLTGNSYGDWSIKDANGSDILTLCNPELGNMSTLPTIELSTSKSGDFDMAYCYFCYNGNNYLFSTAGITMTMSITDNGDRNATIKASLVHEGQTYTIDWTGNY